MEDETSTFELDYSPPLDWPFFLRYLGARATPDVEAVDRDGYVRTIEVGGYVGMLSVRHHPAQARLIVKVRGDAGTQARTVLERVRRIFDLDTDLSSVHATLGADPWLGPLVNACPGIRVPGAWSAFELLVRTIVGQQVTVKAATTIMGRIAGRLGTAVEDARVGEPSFHFPTPRAIAEGNLESIGMPSKRVAALQTVARAIANASIPFPDTEGHAKEVREALLELPGIGPWTVEYFALRALRDADAWPGTDLILRRSIEALTNSEEDAGQSRRSDPDRWKPYRGYAAMHLWNNGLGIIRNPSAGRWTSR